MSDIFRARHSTLEVAMFILPERLRPVVLNEWFLRLGWSGLRQVMTTCKLRGKHQAS